jgi:hypothetical protein
VLPALFDRRSRDLLDLIGPLLPSNGEWSQILHSAAATDRRRRVGARHLDDLRERLVDVEMLNIPEVSSDQGGEFVVAAVREALAGELDVEV